METVQPQWYSEADFERVEAQLARWHSFRQHECWPEFAAGVEGMLFGWRSSLETLSGADVARTQGMIAGARSVLALMASKIQDKEEVIAGMQAENDSISTARSDLEEGK